MSLFNLGLGDWKNPDYKIRLDFARRSKNKKKLFHLAIDDVNESVRLASVKSLNSEDLWYQVVQHATCDRCVESACRLIENSRILEEIILMQELDLNLRLELLNSLEAPSSEFVYELINDPHDILAIWGVEFCNDIRYLEEIYEESLGQERALAILKKVEDETLAISVFEGSSSHDRRSVALSRIQSNNVLKELFLNEHDPSLRKVIVLQCDDSDILMELFEDEDDESVREIFPQQIRNDDWLLKISQNDYNPHVRKTAVHSINSEDYLIEVAINNTDESTIRAVFEKGLSDDALLSIALQAEHERARIESVLRIEKESALEHLISVSNHSDTLWFVGRRKGLFPIHHLYEISSPEVLMTIAEYDESRIAKIAAVRRINEDWALNRLRQKAKGNESLRVVVNTLNCEVSTRTGIRFLNVPNRNYQLSIFPVTGEEFSHWKRDLDDADSAGRYYKMRDLPVTDVTLEEIRQYCKWLEKGDKARYRLPYFHEWKHAAICDSPDWFSVGNMREFANTNENELILFGRENRARPMNAAVPNPWGFLDMIGNILEWTEDVPISEKLISETIPLEEFSSPSGRSSTEPVDLKAFGYASGNHWGDRRIRMGRWKRLIHKDSIDNRASGKIGFRLLRIDPYLEERPLEYSLSLNPQVAVGYTREQVSYEVSQILQVNYDEILKKFSVAPAIISITRDYMQLMRTKAVWERCGALTEVAAKSLQ